MIIHFKKYTHKMTIIAILLLVSSGFVFFTTAKEPSNKEEKAISAESRTENEKPYPLAEVDQTPRILRSVEPLYPFSAKQKNIEGSVTLRFVVTKDGDVTEPEVVESDPPGVFDSSALKAIVRWKFKPAIKNGEAVDVIVHAPLNFKLPANTADNTVVTDTSDPTLSKKSPRIKMSREAQKALYSAQEALKIEKFAAARNFLIDYCARLTEEDKLLEENIPAMFYHLLAQTWIAEDNLEQARTIFKEGWDRYPEDEYLMLNYAITTYNTEHFAEAAPLFEKIYEIRKEKDSRYLHQAAATYYQMENLQEAKRVLKQMFALPEKPKPDWYQMIIQICMGLNQMDEAEDYVRQYLDANPSKANYWIRLAQLQLDRKDYQGGVESFETAYNIKPPDQKSRWMDLANLCMYIGESEKAALYENKACLTQMSIEKVYELFEVDQPPVAIKKPDPIYPLEAKADDIQGTVTLKHRVTKDGLVCNPTIIDATPPDVFNESALRAIRRWRFKPALKEGKAVDVTMVTILKYDPSSPSADMKPEIFTIYDLLQMKIGFKLKESY